MKLLFIIILSFSISLKVKAQQELGQIIVNAGIGYSPEFDGGFGFGGTFYPVSTYPGADWNADQYPYPSMKCSSYTSNKGATIDFGINKLLSIGIASSYQSAIINWSLNDNQYPGPPYSYPYSDNITRVNLALRLLWHLPIQSKHFDVYGGVRFGCSSWHDIPSSNNILTYGSTNTITFLSSPNLVVASCQILWGLRVYLNKYVGAHIEAGIGSPYLVEGGLTVRITTKKDNPTSMQNK